MKPLCDFARFRWLPAGRRTAVLASLLGLLSIGRSAQAADITMAILGIEAAEGAPESVAVALTDALRQRAGNERGLRLVQGRELLAIKIMFSCPDEAQSCMADAAKGLGADRLIFGSVKRSGGDGYVVTLKLLDAARRQIDNYVAEPISQGLASPSSIRGPVQKWFATLMGQSALGTIRVRGDVPGTAIALDGQPIGVIGSDDLIHSNVPAGRREIVASKPGYAPVRREVTVSAGNTVDVPIQMASPTGSPFPMGASGGADSGLGGSGGDDSTRLTASLRDSQRGGLRLASWSTLVTSLTGFGLALKFALDIQAINQDLDPFRRYPCRNSNGHSCAARTGSRCSDRSLWTRIATWESCKTRGSGSRATSTSRSARGRSSRWPVVCSSTSGTWPKTHRAWPSGSVAAAKRCG